MDVQNSGTVQVSFFEKVGAELKRLFTHLPGWEASAAATLTFVAPLVETLLAFIDPETLPTATLLIEKIQSAMAAAAVVIKDAGSTTTLATYLSAIEADLAQVEAAIGMRDAAKAQKITGIVSTLTLEVKAILTQVTALRA